MSFQLIHPLLIDLPESVNTERLTIRCVRPGDGFRVHDAFVDSIDELRQFPASLRWALEAPSIDRFEAFCREGYANFIARRDFCFLLLLRGTDTMVGCCGLHRPNWTVPTIEIGWWGRTPYTGRGLITEGVAGLLDFGFAHLRVCRIAAFVDDLNEKSARVCERTGMQLEGVLRHESADPDGTLRNTRVYSKVRER
jgi:RimJ/RimL family protein N-acetyltransferase